MWTLHIIIFIEINDLWIAYIMYSLQDVSGVVLAICKAKQHVIAVLYLWNFAFLLCKFGNFLVNFIVG